MLVKLSLKRSVFLACILFLTLVLVLDRILVARLFFYIPNELGWDTSPWYNFLHKRFHISFSSEEEGVLVVGSSVALYSALPREIEQRLQTETKKKYHENKIR
ncbi:MAG: hypothetical protein AAF518_21260, partial [Spirochaetota bacterium]